MDHNYRLQILNGALDARVKEVTEYQVNIDNFRLALDLISMDDGMAEFRMQLTELLEANIREQRKAEVMLHVIRKQLDQA